MSANVGFFLTVTVPAPTNSQLERDVHLFHEIVSDCSPTLVLTTHQYREFMKSKDIEFLADVSKCDPDWPKLPYIETDNMTGVVEEHTNNASVSAEDVAFIQYTSGSTGEAKGVVITHSQLTHNLLFQVRAFKVAYYSVEVVWIPHHDFMGLVSCLLLALHVGYRVYLMSTSSFFRQPGLWLEVISNVRATTAKAPSFAFELLLRNPPKTAPEVELSCLETVYALEASVSSILTDFASEFYYRNRFAVTVQAVYGLAEHTGIATVQSPPYYHIARLGLPSHEFPPDNVVLKVVDPVTLRECCDRQMGEIWLDSPSKASGYWEQPRETKAIFQAQMQGDDQRTYLRTGDLGFVEDSQLFIAGPMSDILAFEGNLVFPQHVELTVQITSSLIRPGSIAVINVHPQDGYSTVIVVAEVCDVETVGDVEELCGDISRALALKYRAPPYAVCLIKPNTMPRTHLGKVQRAKVRELYKSDKLDMVFRVVTSISPLLNVEAKKTVEGVLEEVIKPVLTRVEQVFDRNTDILTQGLQSLDIMDLQEVIKTELEVDITFNEILQLGTPIRIAEEIGRQLSLTGAEIAPVELKDQSYFAYPDIGDLKDKTQDELKAVEGFCLGRKGFGLVVFPGVTDVSVLDLKTFRLESYLVGLPVNKRTGSPVIAEPPVQVVRWCTGAAAVM